MGRATRAAREERLARLAQMRLWSGADAPPYGWVSARDAGRILGVAIRTIERDKAELRRRAAAREAHGGVSAARDTDRAVRNSARISHVPRSCLCTWRYHWGTSRWVRTAAIPGCPWHTQRRAAS